MVVKNLAELLVYLLGRRHRWKQAYLSPLRDRCLACDQLLTDSPLYQRYRICPHCRFHYTLTARERIQLLADEGTFKETSRSIVSIDPLSFSSRTPYKQRLSQDQKRTGLLEAAVTGRCTIGGIQTVILVLDFGFLGGSMGSVVGEKVALAFELAAKKEQPLLAIVSGGGIRLQEGVLSLMQMAKTVVAASCLQRKGLPFITVFANPATGQAYASFSNLADIILSEPGALLGLAPLRTLKEATLKSVPLDAHTAEAHLRNGLLDDVVDREELRDRLASLLAILTARENLKTRRKEKEKAAPAPSPEVLPVWEVVQRARHQGRPTALDYIHCMTSGFVQLHGDRVHGDDPSIVGGVAMLQGQGVVVIGQQRLREGDGQGPAHIYPEGFRKAQRLLRLAAKLQLPVITLLDTPGAYPGLEGEEWGVGNALADTLSLMASLRTPILSVVIGEGGSEGALALGVADRILMLEHAIYAPLSPEQAAARLYRDTSRARELARSLKLRAQDCLELEIVDAIVPEPEGGAHTEPDLAAQHLQQALLGELAELMKTSPRKLVKLRQKKFRRMGEHSSYFKEALKQDLAHFQGLLAKRVKGPSREGGKKKKTKEPAIKEEPQPPGKG